jgi:hypothetical protein
MSRLDEMLAAAGDEEVTLSDDDAGAEPAADAAPATESPPGSGAASAADSAPAKDGKPAPEKPAPEKDDPKLASKFAALARRQEKLLDTEAQITTRERELSSRLAQVEAREKESSSRFEKLLTDPDVFFRHLESMGVTFDSLQAWSKGNGPLSKPEKKPEYVTREELEAERKRDAEEARKADFAARRDIVNRQFIEETDKLDAAKLVFSPAKRIEIGDDIADRAAKRGIRLTLPEIAAAVNELAEQDPWYQARHQASGAPVSQKDAAAAATEVTDSNGAQGSRATTIGNDVAGERTGANGGRRLSHRERVALMRARAD